MCIHVCIYIYIYIFSCTPGCLELGADYFCFSTHFSQTCLSETFNSGPWQDFDIAILDHFSCLKSLKKLTFTKEKLTFLLLSLVTISENDVGEFCLREKITILLLRAMQKAIVVLRQINSFQEIIVLYKT